MPLSISKAILNGGGKMPNRKPDTEIIFTVRQDEEFPDFWVSELTVGGVEVVTAHTSSMDDAIAVFHESFPEGGEKKLF